MIFHWRQCKWQTHFALLREMSLLSLASFCQIRAVKLVTFQEYQPRWLNMKPIDADEFNISHKLLNWISQLCDWHCVLLEPWESNLPNMILQSITLGRHLNKYSYLIPPSTVLEVSRLVLVSRPVCFVLVSVLVWNPLVLVLILVSNLLVSDFSAETSN